MTDRFVVVKLATTVGLMVMDRLAASQPANRQSCLGEREEHDTPNLVSDSRLLPIKGPCFLFVHSVLHRLPKS